MAFEALADCTAGVVVADAAGEEDRDPEPGERRVVRNGRDVSSVAAPIQTTWSSTEVESTRARREA